MTVERFREQARAGSFSYPARARKKVRVMEPAMLDGVAQRACDWFLTRYFVKRLRAPLTSNYLIGHRYLELLVNKCNLEMLFPFSELERVRKSGQTPDFPATHAAVATVAPFPAWRGSQG